MGGSLTLGRLKGIAIEVHVSWFIVLVFFSYSLAQAYFPPLLPELGSGGYLLLGAVTTLILFASVLAHEMAHSLVAIAEGLGIKKITLFIFGGVAQLQEEPPSPLAELKITIAGPLTSLLLAACFYLGHLAAGRAGVAAETFFILARVNLIMAAINMIPAFPLDGGRVLRSLLWLWRGRILPATKTAVTFGAFFAFLAIGAGIVIVLQGNIWGLWYVFLGFMLYQAGQSSYAQLALNELFRGVKIAEIMSHPVQTVSPWQKLSEVVEQFYRYKYGAFPVARGKELLGLITLHQIRDVPREQWPFRDAGQVMTPLAQAATVSPGEEAVNVMIKMAAANYGRALVVDDTGLLVGIISNTDLMRLVKIHTILGPDLDI